MIVGQHVAAQTAVSLRVKHARGAPFEPFNFYRCVATIDTIIGQAISVAANELLDASPDAECTLEELACHFGFWGRSPPRAGSVKRFFFF